MWVFFFSRGAGSTFNVQICLPSPLFLLTKLVQVRVAAKGRIPSELPCLILCSLGRFECFPTSSLPGHQHSQASAPTFLEILTNLSRSMQLQNSLGF